MNSIGDVRLSYYFEDKRRLVVLPGVMMGGYLSQFLTDCGIQQAKNEQHLIQVDEQTRVGNIEVPGWAELHEKLARVVAIGDQKTAHELVTAWALASIKAFDPWFKKMCAVDSTLGLETPAYSSAIGEIGETAQMFHGWIRGTCCRK